MTARRVPFMSLVPGEDRQDIEAAIARVVSTGAGKDGQGFADLWRGLDAADDAFLLGHQRVAEPQPQRLQRGAGDPARAWRMCGHASVHGSSWCAHHLGRVRGRIVTAASSCEAVA